MVKNLNTGKPLTREDKNKIAEAASIIMDVFDWDTTNQGGEYWEEVHSNLLVIAHEEPATCESCGQKLPDAK